jgi:hypothetical protein
MSHRHQSASSGFLAPFESALQDYVNQTGITLSKHPLAEQLQNCSSVESITALLQEKAQALGEIQGSDRMMNSLNNVVSIMCSLSGSAALSDATGLVCRIVPSVKGILLL